MCGLVEQGGGVAPSNSGWRHDSVRGKIKAGLAAREAYFPSGCVSDAPPNGEKERIRPEPAEFTWEQGSILRSGKRMAQTGGRLFGVVREAAMFFQNVTRGVPGNTLDSIRKLYDKGRLSYTVMNDQNVFTVDTHRFPFLMAAQLPGILRPMRCIDVCGIFARFEFLYARPNCWLLLSTETPSGI